ncbi:penicillin-binding transpeptidase domain-containing protein [Butyricicoccus porcorum]|uniref:penicillin-binding transpeptidase domain-containing protein n=1 Tax=Butyricicoccus porcorum TaxID=1945634 RepID=UPI003F4AA643
MANNLCGNKIQIRYRIEKISDFSRENRKTVLRGACIILMISLLSVLQLPVLAFFANNTNIYMPDASINIDAVDYSDIFGDNNGSVVIYDQKADSYMVYHLNKAEEQIAPCSTFKIFSALNALEQGIITPEDSVLSWNGSDYEFQAWNQDHNLNSAMQNSVNWYFQYLDTTVGARELSAFYKKIGYGNGCIGRDTEQYWNGSSLKISPLEQVELLQKFYNNSFDFDEANIKTVKQAMLCSENSDNKLYGKTGTGKVNEVEVIGWFIGFVETSDNTYFFAVNLQNASGTNGKEATQITYSIFHAMGIRMG